MNRAVTGPRIDSEMTEHGSEYDGERTENRPQIGQRKGREQTVNMAEIGQRTDSEYGRERAENRQ